MQTPTGMQERVAAHRSSRRAKTGESVSANTRDSRANTSQWISRVAISHFLGALVLVWTSTVAPLGLAQDSGGELPGEESEEELVVEQELLDREPFYELTLDAANDNAVLEILPIPDVPDNPESTYRLRIRLLREPGQEYDVLWRHVANLRTYNDMVRDRADQLTREGKFNEAFRYYDYVLRNSTASPDLKRALLEYLLASASALADEQKYEHALAVLEEVTRRDGSYRAAEVATRMARLADELIAREVAREDHPSARGLIERLEKQYGADRLASLGQWRRKLIDEAATLRRQAEQAMEQQQYRAADRLSRRMMRIWPKIPGGDQMRDEIARLYPMVIVGVAERADQQDVTSLDNWPARRTGRLTQRRLVRFLGAGPEGGQYLCPLGEYRQSDDRRRLTFELAQLGDSSPVAQVDGYMLSQRVLEMGDPDSPHYDPAWAALMQGTRVEDVFKLQIELRRPHVLPEAMLQIPVEAAGADAGQLLPSEGPYKRADSTDDDLHFTTNPHYPFPGSHHPLEIVERRYATSEEAIAALRRNQIDVIDFLYPGDVARLRDDEAWEVMPYALPTLHMLIPSSQNPFTADATFRRALVYGINRQAILQTELLGNDAMAGCQVISGPFPVGTRTNDPLAYAYDERVEPRAYYPRLALTLKTLAHRSLREQALKRGQEIPSEIQLVLGFPGNQLARVACQAISQYLQVVGIACELRELPPGMSHDPTGEVDLLYVQVAMWEPMIDARRLLAPAGTTGVSNEYVGMALRRLDAARNWREVRQRLHELHRIVHEEVPVIPLWQTVNYLVHSRRLDGVGPAPLTLYENVEQWQVVPLEKPTETVTLMP